MAQPPSMQRVSDCLARLAGVGKRSADRMAQELALDQSGLATELASALSEMAGSVCPCSRCGNLTRTGENPCPLCTSPQRDARTVCVVEEPSDISAIERAGAYRGRYHALMGRLSPMKGMGPEHLRVKSLMARIDEEGFTEVILALSTDMEGESTSSFLGHLLRGKKVRVTRLATGIPARSGIGYSDAVTLARAIKGRIAEQE